MPSNRAIRKAVDANSRQNGCRCVPDVKIKQPSVSKGRPLSIRVFHDESCPALEQK